MSLHPLSTHERRYIPAPRPMICPATSSTLTDEQCRVWVTMIRGFRADHPRSELSDAAICEGLGLPPHLSARVVEFIAEGKADEVTP